MVSAGPDQLGPGGGIPLTGGGHPCPDTGFELFLRCHIETFRPRSDARLHASERRATVLEDVHIGWLSWRLAKSPLLPPRRVAWRPGLGVRRRTRRTHRLAVPVGINRGGSGKRSVSRFCQTAAEAPVFTGPP